ncbi:DUF1593 domain-containing protein [Clostridium felsineum]|uniref:DUF1593 domain-containing protein n=1 Tax=Clostridium felsineum TaxID=36839 RepID=UPI00214D16C2|nr:DUF1593 domain-containing protein [Clostridium felsineum]MCR3758713.1 DUF1593 domain-containing protein [Clostridium felsineum]
MRRSKSLLAIPLVLALSSSILSGCTSSQEAGTKSTTTVKKTSTNSEKPRTVITTDGEVDDMNSFKRLLLYSNEMDIAGIVLSSSTYHYAGDEKSGVKPYRWTGTQWVQDDLNAYEKVYPNLSVQAKGFPTADYLRSIYKVGNIKNVGDMSEDTDGSNLLKKLFLDDDKRTLYVQTWGGTNTTARALKSIEDQYGKTKQWPEIQKKINDKVVIYIILNQDSTYSNYIAKKWPKIKILNDQSNFWRFAYAWKFNPSQVNGTFSGDWMNSNIKSGHGPLFDRYALMGDGNHINGELEDEQRGSDAYLEKNPQYKKNEFISEGDSPSFLYLVNNGLRSYDNPEYGGWGGRFTETNNTLWQNNALDYDPYTKQYEAEYSLMRWFDDAQNDFASRVAWCTAATYKDANHAPTLTIKEGNNIEAAAGDKVTLHAIGKDPDGDKLTYSWSHYAEADSYSESKVKKNKVEQNKNQGLIFSIYRKLAKNETVDNLKLTGSSTSTMSFTVPKDAKKGDTIEIIAQVQDNGKFTLKHYQRVIITVK